MSVHTLSRIHMARGALAQAAKEYTLRSGAYRVRLRDVVDLLSKELRETNAAKRRPSDRRRRR